MNLTSRARHDAGNGPSSVGIIGYAHGATANTDLANHVLRETLKKTNVKDIALEIPADDQHAVDHYLSSPRKEADRERLADIVTTKQCFPQGYHVGDGALLAIGGLHGLASQPNMHGMAKTLDTIAESGGDIKVHCVDAKSNSEIYQKAAGLINGTAPDKSNPSGAEIGPRNSVMAENLSRINAPHGVVMLTGALHAGHGDHSLDDEINKRGVPTKSVSLVDGMNPKPGVDRYSFGDLSTHDAHKASSFLADSINKHAPQSHNHTEESLPGKFEDISAQQSLRHELNHAR